MGFFHWLFRVFDLDSTLSDSVKWELAFWYFEFFSPIFLFYIVKHSLRLKRYKFGHALIFLVLFRYKLFLPQLTSNPTYDLPTSIFSHVYELPSLKTIDYLRSTKARGNMWQLTRDLWMTTNFSDCSVEMGVVEGYYYKYYSFNEGHCYDEEFTGDKEFIKKALREFLDELSDLRISNTYSACHYSCDSDGDGKNRKGTFMFGTSVAVWSMPLSSTIYLGVFYYPDSN